MGTKKIVTRPNESQCEGCPDWDDVNGCWANIVDVDCCERLGEDGLYPFWDDEDEEEYPIDEDRPRCSCRFCHCLNETEYGEVCSDCLQGAHQG